MSNLSAFLHAPFPCFLSSSHTRPFLSSKRTTDCSSMSASARVAVVGDVHDDWNLEEDTKALQLLQLDLVLFTGRFSSPSPFTCMVSLAGPHLIHTRCLHNPF